MDIRPVDLPELRDETRRDVAAHYPAIYESFIREEKQFWMPMMAPRQAAVHMVNAEVARLGTAELFYVSADMTNLAKTAALTMPEFTLAPEDLPARSGLVYFDSPVDVFKHDEPDGSTSDVAIVAASWGDWHDVPPGYPAGGVWITWYSDRDVNVQNSSMFPTPEAKQRARRLRSRFLLHTETPAPFGFDGIYDGIVTIEDDRIDMTTYQELIKTENILRWVGALKATWLLMQQPLADVTEIQPDRAARKRLARAGAKPAPVRVIELRRPKHSGPGDGSREYHHSWIVRGHWRQQWYPKREVHRPVWIAPHIKGPEDAPLIGGEKVYAWKR